MTDQKKLQEDLMNGALDARLWQVYGENADLMMQRTRLSNLVKFYEQTFSAQDAVGLFSGPGRTELGGNHTDHQHGRVLAAAINLDAVACAAPNHSQIICILSSGYPRITVDLSDLSPREEEQQSSVALVRGVAARIASMGYKLGGFNAVIESTVLSGSGLSSSAAYEILIGVIFNHLFCEDALTPVDLALCGQYAENVFFGKPCGLMDQLASAVGGIVAIDFASPTQPDVRKIGYDMEKSGYSLCIIDTGADHADLTDEYAAIPHEMNGVAHCFGREYLRDVDERAFWSKLSEVRAQAGDRAALRAMHFFADNQYAAQEAECLAQGAFDEFLQLVRRSGVSSAQLLQNLYCVSAPQNQAVCVAIALAEHLLAGDGAVRVHGGGFAGTIQAYVPTEKQQAFLEGMESVLGKGCCHFLRIRAVGGAILA
ncbi:MAG: galactokinase family protein [Butyricicoccus sp.]|nr:galactokinase family protein [Butyricicoccus sp.]